MSILSADLRDVIRARSQVQTLAGENANLRMALQRMLEAPDAGDPDEVRLAAIQARATLRQSEVNARARQR